MTAGLFVSGSKVSVLLTEAYHSDIAASFELQVQF
jgi:hypothetical protein